MTSIVASSTDGGSQTVAIVTSRLKRLLTRDDVWLAGLRAALQMIALGDSRLIFGDGTAGVDLIRHLAARLKIANSEFVPSVHSETAYTVPARDRALVAAADVVYVLRLRAGGNLHRLLAERIQQRRGRVILVDLPNLQPESIKAEFRLAGAELWQPTPEQCRPLEGMWQNDSPCNPSTNVSEDAVYLIVPFPTSECWPFLTHTTRSRPGPWPDESFEQYADRLIESRPEADHSALGTLRRIIDQKNLIASGQTIRGGNRVVSLTACPLEKLPELHRFRPHRVRWDFEPYGLCFRREWLMSRGARPVNYADESGWKSLSEADRPFFQLAMGKSGIDWTIEQEWRVCGDLSLADLSPSDVLLFVPNFESAKSLAEVTDWPITLWPERSRADSDT